MISERALKGQRDKLHFCTSLAPSNVIPTGSLARLLKYTTYFNTNTDLPTPDVEDYKVDKTSACYQQPLQVTWFLVVCTMTRSTIGGGGRGCNKFIPVLGGNGTKIAPTGDIFDQPPDQMR